MKRTPSAADRQIVAALVRRQADQDWTDAEMAEALGVSRAMWSMTRSGKKHVGLTLARGALQRFPSLQDDVLIFLREKVTQRTIDGASDARIEEPAR